MRWIARRYYFGQNVDALISAGAVPLTLDAEQLKFFEREGYLVVPDAFDSVDLEPAITEITSVIHERSTQAVARGDLSQTYAHEPFETRLWKIHQEYEDIYWSLLGRTLEAHGIFPLIANGALLDLAEAIVGPEIIASAVYVLRPKLPGHWHGEVPWHQDSGYFEPVCDRGLILTVWVPFVDATIEWGCLEMMPRSHTGGVVRHRQLAPGGGAPEIRVPGRIPSDGYLQIADEDLPGDQVVPVPVNRGGVVLLTNRTAHRSTPNHSDIVRWSIDIRYQSTDLPTNYPLPSQRGDGVGMSNTTMSAERQALSCYPPEPDFLVRSRSRPASVVDTWEAFDAHRRTHQPLARTVRWEDA